VLLGQHLESSWRALQRAGFEQIAQVVHHRARLETAALSGNAENVVEGGRGIAVVLRIERPLHVVAEPALMVSVGFTRHGVVDERTPLRQRPVLIAGAEDLMWLPSGWMRALRVIVVTRPVSTALEVLALVMSVLDAFGKFA
jgi:hypothetical protein